MGAMPLPLRLALRELRGGLAGFRIFLVCLVLGVAAIAAVGSARAAIEAGLSREAAALLGGDAQVEFAYRFADDAERAWIDGAAEAVSGIVDFRSMATVPRPGGEERLLVQVKAVDGAYPLYGRVGLAGGGTLAAALAARDGLPGLVAEAGLVDRLGLHPGDVVRLGTQDFRLADTLTSEPDASTGGFAFGPRVIVALPALGASGLLAPGSMFDSAYRLRLVPGADLAALRAEAEARFGDAGLQWRDRGAGAPRIGRFVDRLGSFLILVGLAGLAVGGVGIASAVAAHVEGKTATIATLKTLGATGGTIFAIYLAQVAAIAALGITLGLVVGAVLPLLAAPLVQAALPVPAAFGLYWKPLVEAAVYGGLTVLIFALWPLGRAREVRAAALYRDRTAGRRWPRPAIVAATAGLGALLVGLAAWRSGSPELALGVAGGVVLALAMLAAAAALLRRAARAVQRTRLASGRPALRWALAALGAPGETTAAVLSLGLGLGVLAAVGQVDWNLRAMIAQDLPDRAPAYFFIDIQPDQRDAFLATAAAVPGVGRIDTAPMLRGVIARINGKPAREVAGPHWALNGDRGVSFAATPPEGTVLTEGTWWAPDAAGPPQVSFAEAEGRELGLKLGDVLTVNVLGRDLDFTITSFRSVRFESMGINFLMIANPASLAGAPYSSIATVEAAPQAEAPLIRAVGGAFPNVTAIRVRDAIDRVATTLDGIATATRAAASITLLTGLVVLVGGAAAGEARRAREAAILKTIGATRGRILASFALRAALIGAAAGLVALGAGAAAGWWVTARVLEAPFRFDIGNALAIVAGGTVASLLATLAFARRPLAVRPAQVLRARE